MISPTIPAMKIAAAENELANTLGCPLVLTPEAARDGLRESVNGRQAQQMAPDGAVKSEAFHGHAATCPIRNRRNEGPSLIEKVALREAI